MVSWSRLGWVVWLVVGFSLVLNISNIARVGITDTVGDDLGATIGKVDTVLARGGIAISVLILGKVSTRVVISNSIAVLVDSRLIISWLMVWSWLVNNWSWVVDWGWLVDHWGWVVDWGWLVHNWGSMIHWGWLVDHWSWVVHWGWVVDWGMVHWGVVHWGVVHWGVVHKAVVHWDMVDWGMVDWGMDWDMGWSMDSSAVLLSSIWVVDILWGSMRLAGNHSSIGAMGLVHRVAHSGSISVLDDLVVGLGSSSSWRIERAISGNAAAQRMSDMAFPNNPHSSLLSPVSLSAVTL